MDWASLVILDHLASTAPNNFTGANGDNGGLEQLNLSYSSDFC
jgi:hypothetical protein